MKEFELGQVFEGKIEGKPVTVVVTQPFGKAAMAAIAPDRDEKIILHQNSIAAWKETKATKSDYYLEAVSADGQLVWSLFIPGFEAAVTFFAAHLPDIRWAGGNIRVSTAEGASEGEMMYFDDAGAYGLEPLIGEGAAIGKLC
jgi:hypothetical protein